MNRYWKSLFIVCAIAPLFGFLIQRGAPTNAFKRNAILKSQFVASPPKPQKVNDKMINPPIVEVSYFTKFEPHLSQWSELNKKLLKSSLELEHQKLILNNESILQWAAQAIHDPNLSVKSRNQSLALLLDGLAMNSPYIHDILSQTVADKSIEYSTLPISERQLMAEFKAEILFSWSSSQPEQMTFISSLLPGPVSQKIWENILNEQSKNIETSSLEL